MQNAKLFQYAVIFHPTEKERKENDAKSKLIVQPTTVLSIDEKSLGLRVAMEIPQEYKEMLDQIEICVSPF